MSTIFESVLMKLLMNHVICLIGLAAVLTGCPLVRGTGNAVQATGEGIGHAVEGTGQAIGQAGRELAN